MRNSSVFPAPLPAGYQPLMPTGSLGGPYEPMSCSVTGPSPAFTNDWMPVSSPAIGTGGKSRFVGSGLPAFTGMLWTSKIHWSDGSPLMASPPSGTAVAPAEVTAESVPRETPAAPLKPTVTSTDAPG